jgi:hypothetical protein
MSLNLFLQAGMVPANATLPGNAQTLANFIAAYVAIAGGQNFNGINFGSVTPSADNRDKPWWRTDANNQPLGMYSWNGSAWVTTSFIIPNGASVERPLNPANYTEFFDTTINRLLIYERGQWRTADGCTGEVRHVKAATIAAALTLNPGWIQDTDSIARVIGGAGTAAGVGDHAYGETAGSENITLGINQIPTHNHTAIVLTGSEADNGDAGNLVVTASTQSVGARTIDGSSTGNAGSGEAHSNLQPVIYYWSIVKQ